MRLTLLKAKEVLASHAPADVLEDRINRAIERILVSGKFNGGMDRIGLQVLYGDLTLPRQWRTIEGVKVDRNADGSYMVRQLTNGWYEFLEGKVSVTDTQRSGFGSDTVRSLGDGHACMHDLPTGGTISILPKDVGIILVVPPYTVKIYGKDTNYMPTTLTLTNAAPVAANPFMKIDRIHKDQGPYNVTVTHTATDATTTTLAIMEPTEEETFYRRYRDDSLTSVASCTAVAYAKKRHLELTSDEDVLPITNITALGMAMDSLQYLAENDVSLSRQYQDSAIDLLNEELKDSHSADEIPGLRFHGLLPRLRSHY